MKNHKLCTRLFIAAFTVVLTGCEPSMPREGDTASEDAATLKPEMVELEGGRFLMGSRDGSKWERPVHCVTIKPFEIGMYEVLGFQYKAFEKATSRSSSTKPREDDAPVTDVSWYDAEAYIAWLNGRTGLKYRLPTEAEWEYAARAGSTTAYHFGDDENLLSLYANYGGRNSGPMTAGNFRPNAWGIYDMLGNVQEWVEDCWHKDYSDAPSDGRAWESGCDMKEVAVVRGGSWFNDAGFLRSANRFRINRTSRYDDTGFRLARELCRPKTCDESHTPPRNLKTKACSEQ